MPWEKEILFRNLNTTIFFSSKHLRKIWNKVYFLFDELNSQLRFTKNWQEFLCYERSFSLIGENYYKKTYCPWPETSILELSGKFVNKVDTVIESLHTCRTFELTQLFPSWVILYISDKTIFFFFFGVGKLGYTINTSTFFFIIVSEKLHKKKSLSTVELTVTPVPPHSPHSYFHK